MKRYVYIFSEEETQQQHSTDGNAKQIEHRRNPQIAGNKTQWEKTHRSDGVGKAQVNAGTECPILRK